MARKPSTETRMTLYRLVGFPALAKVIREKYSEFTEERVMVGERRSVLYWGRTPDKPVKWADTVAGLSGVSVELATGVAAAVLVIPGSDKDEAAADFAWAVTFGMGFHLLDQRYIDSGFGQKVAIRTADPARLNSITKVTLDESAKTDRSSIPVGASLRSFGFEDIGELATRVVASGIIDGIGLGGKPVTIRGADALSLPLSKRPAEFLADLDRLVEILDRAPASDELADLERRPVPVRARRVRPRRCLHRCRGRVWWPRCQRLRSRCREFRCCRGWTCRFQCRESWSSLSVK
ncbi:DUF6119 family protein [Nocardia sp. NPDC058705]|uniref:DUF6119 family protein n=1 Tax=Nocardia sp. NPDC058705 TaxID=3346609 RepID=UPI0036B44B71